MYDLNLAKVNRGLTDAIKVVGAIRRMVGPNSDIKNELQDMDRELRAAAGECQRVLALIIEDQNRGLLVQDR